MRYFLFILFFLLCLWPAGTKATICDISTPEKALYCEYDKEGMCCLVEVDRETREIWCYEFNQCTWSK